MRRRRGTASRRGSCRCFNGAATLSLRRLRFGIFCWCIRFDTSMGPQLYRCGDMISTKGPRYFMSCFNGAATLSLRRRWSWTDSAPQRISFNGAATLSLRRHGCSCEGCSASRALQWGRNFIVAETAPYTTRFLLRFLLQWGRNFIVAETLICWNRRSRRGQASMGPQLYRCGD